MTFFYPNDEKAWNDPKIGVQWLRVEGEYCGSASAERCSFDGVKLNLSDKDQK